MKHPGDHIIEFFGHAYEGTKTGPSACSGVNTSGRQVQYLHRVAPGGAEYFIRLHLKENEIESWDILAPVCTRNYVPMVLEALRQSINGPKNAVLVPMTQEEIDALIDTIAIADQMTAEAGERRPYVDEAVKITERLCALYNANDNAE